MGMKRSKLQTIWLPILAALGFFALTLPVWRWLWSEWMSNEYYSHGILILPVALFLAVQRIRNDPRLNYGAGGGSQIADCQIGRASSGHQRTPCGCSISDRNRVLEPAIRKRPDPRVLGAELGGNRQTGTNRHRLFTDTHTIWSCNQPEFIIICLVLDSTLMRHPDLQSCTNRGVPGRTGGPPPGCPACPA